MLRGPCNTAGNRLITRAETKDVDFDGILSGLADKVGYDKLVGAPQSHDA